MLYKHGWETKKEREGKKKTNMRFILDFSEILVFQQLEVSDALPDKKVLYSIKAPNCYFFSGHHLIRAKALEKSRSHHP